MIGRIKFPACLSATSLSQPQSDLLPVFSNSNTTSSPSGVSNTGPRHGQSNSKFGGGRVLKGLVVTSFICFAALFWFASENVSQNLRYYSGVGSLQIKVSPLRAEARESSRLQRRILTEEESTLGNDGSTQLGNLDALDGGLIFPQNRSKYLVRDYNSGLGFNNMRYIIETALLHAKLLNRTLILPSFIYARGCEESFASCSAVWPEIDFLYAVDRSQWITESSSAEARRGWRIPIGTMIDINSLERKYGAPILTVPDYLGRYSAGAQEQSNGRWNQGEYQVPNLTYAAVNQLLQDSFHLVDTTNPVATTLLPGQTPVQVPVWLTHDVIRAILQNHLGNSEAALEAPLHLHDLIRRFPSEIRMAIDREVGESIEVGPKSPGVLRGEGLMGFVGGIDAKTELVRRWLDVMMFQSDCDWMLLRSYDDYQELLLAKPTHRVEYSVAYKRHLRGFVDQYNSETADILHLRGEFHLRVKPGAMRFTSATGQAKLTKIILNDISTDVRIEEFAQELDRRMVQKANGRQWMGAHLRRGDMPGGWLFSPNITLGMAKIRSELCAGSQFLRSSRAAQLEGRQVPGAPQLTSATYSLALPESTDPFYVATDERDPVVLAEIRAAGGVILSDLVTQEDRARLGNNALLTDWMGLVEQALLAKSAYFFGSRLSSFTGGIVNMRVGMQKGWRTSSAA